MASLPGSLPGATCRGRGSPRHLHEKPRSSVARGVCGRPAEGTVKVAVTAQCTAQLRTSPPLSLLPEPTALTFSRVSFSSLSGGRGGQGTERAGRRRSAFLLWRLWARAQTMPSAQPGAADGAPRALLALGPPKAPARTPRHSNDLTAQRTDLVTCPRPGSRVHPCPCKDTANTLPSGTCSGESTNERMTVTPFDSFREQGRKPSDRHTVRPGRVGTAEIIREDAARTAVPHSPSCEGCR